MLHFARCFKAEEYGIYLLFTLSISPVSRTVSAYSYSTAIGSPFSSDLTSALLSLVSAFSWIPLMYIDAEWF